MQSDFWNQRYAETEFVYGAEPNAFFKQFIDEQPKEGSILLPADGESRNGVYAALKGWSVDAFDFSETAREKAFAYAKSKGVHINYSLQEFDSFSAAKQYDVVALIYVHMPQDLRKQLHTEIIKAVKPGGFLVLEAFNKNQLNYNTGGPKDVSMLYDEMMLKHDFAALNIISCHAATVVLNEGPFHNGEAAVVRLIARK